jgi:hypothetical protein
MERKFELLPGVLQVLLEQGEDPDDIVPILSEAAKLARTKKLKSLLVISGLGDPANAQAISRAIEQIHATGPSSLKIAFVACLIPQYSAYHFAERYAQKFGIMAKVLVSTRQAKDWLGLREDARARALQSHPGEPRP